ncbi:MAG: MraY family glycosyltransferase [Thermodesulfobacteriota bacterium]
MNSELVFILSLFALSLSISLVLVPFSSRIARLVGVIDRPCPRKIHKDAIPRMGGLAIACAVLLTLLGMARDKPVVVAFCLGAAIVAFTGLLDDKFRLSVRLKLGGQILAAVAFMLTAQMSLSGLGNLFGLGNVGLGTLSPVVTVFCMAGVMNAFNLSDGLDGLAGGLGAIACLFLAAFAYEHQVWHLVYIAVVLFGALLGFLRYNIHPAKLFMGDTGSLLVGYGVAVLAVGLVEGSAGGVRPASPVTPALLLALPIADTIWVMCRRILKACSPFQPDKTHLHHRLMGLGLGHSSTVTIIYTLMVFFSTASWLSRGQPDWLRFHGGVLSLVLLYGTMAVLEARQVNLDGFIGRFRLTYRIRSDNQSFRPTLREQLMSGGGILLGVLCALPVFFLGNVSSLAALFSWSAALIICLYYPWAGQRQQMVLAHGLFYAAAVLLLYVYFQQDWPRWPWYSIGVLAALFILFTIRSRPDPILQLTSFDFLLLSFTWILSLILAPLLGMSFDKQLNLIASCALAVPLLCMMKMTARRSISRNRLIAVGFVVVFLLIGLRRCVFFM